MERAEEEEVERRSRDADTDTYTSTQGSLVRRCDQVCLCVCDDC